MTVSPGLRTIAYAVVVLGIFLGYLPWQVLQLDAVIAEYLSTILTYSGVALLLVGAALTFSGAYYLVWRGEGTPMPLDPPQRMVVAGPYTRMQHPMMLGLFALSFGEAAWLRSPSLGVYAFVLTVLVNLYIVYVEEPALEKRFGEDYRAYRAAVPRWLPFGRPGM
jgi:protein-S-isoprenylcysteine O-methyltransferase Ste14